MHTFSLVLKYISECVGCELSVGLWGMRSCGRMEASDWGVKLKTVSWQPDKHWVGTGWGQAGQHNNYHIPAANRSSKCSTSLSICHCHTHTHKHTHTHSHKYRRTESHMCTYIHTHTHIYRGTVTRTVDRNKFTFTVHVHIINSNNTLKSIQMHTHTHTYIHTLKTHSENSLQLYQFTLTKPRLWDLWMNKVVHYLLLNIFSPLSCQKKKRNIPWRMSEGLFWGKV